MYPRHTRHTWRLLSLLLVAVPATVLVALSLMFVPRTALADSPHVDTMLLNTDIGPASLQYLTQTIDTAEHDGSRALIIQVDSPGGDTNSMQSMAMAELNSTVPIITYVSPAGAYAASAAAIVTLSAPIAAMAPTTRIGATSPINSDGSNLDTTLQTKIENDLVAFITGVQTRFHREKSIPYVTTMITKAASYDTASALNDGIVDLQASSMTDLLNQVNGQTITLYNGQVVTLQTESVTVQTLNPTLFDTLYSFLLDPNVVFLLFIIALIGIFLEISHPGAILPGTVGGIALILFLFAIGSLSINWAGLALMALAFVLLVVDLRAPTHGILTVGAMIALIFGALILFDNGVGYGTPAIDPVVVYVMAGFVGVLSFALISVIVRAQRRRVATGGPAAMIGARAVALTPLLPEGRVDYGGENWAAILDGPGTSLDAGAEVQIVSLEGLRLHVRPWSDRLITTSQSVTPLKQERM